EAHSSELRLKELRCGFDTLKQSFEIPMTSLTLLCRCNGPAKVIKHVEKIQNQICACRLKLLFEILLEPGAQFVILDSQMKLCLLEPVCVLLDLAISFFESRLERLDLPRSNRRAVSRSIFFQISLRQISLRQISLGLDERLA